MFDPKRRVTAGPCGLAVRGPMRARIASLTASHMEIQHFPRSAGSPSRAARLARARSRAAGPDAASRRDRFAARNRAVIPS